MQEWASSTHKRIGENFAQEYVAALDRKGYELTGKDDAKTAWKTRDEKEHTFYVIKRWLTHLGKFDEVVKLLDEQTLKPKTRKNQKVNKLCRTQNDVNLDDIMAKLKADPTLLAKVKEMI